MSKHIFDKDELISILSKTLGKTLGEVDVNHVFNRTIENPKITGIAGDVIEQSVLGYPADTRQEPDLVVSGVNVELKTTGIRKSKNADYEYEAKEPLSVTAVSPDKIAKEEFFTSTFWDKAEHMLFVYYLYNSDKTVTAREYMNFPIKGFQFHEFNSEEIKTLENDWKVVRDFIRNVKRRNLDIEIEYPKISKLRDKMLMLDTAPKYPNNPRFRLKRSVVTNIYQKKFGNALEELPKEYTSYKDIDNECHDLTEHFVNESIESIAETLNIRDNLNNKAICERLVVNMFGGQFSQKLKELDIFNKYGLIGKTIVLTKDKRPTEQMKLFQIDFEEIMNKDISFEESSFRDYFAQHQFLFIVYEEPSHDDPLSKNVFKGFKRYSFDDDFINNNVKPVWDRIRKLIFNKELIEVFEYDRNGEKLINRTGVPVSAPNFPKQREGNVFVRGSSSNSLYKPLVINDIAMYSQYIWLKGSYVVDVLNSLDYL